MSRKSKKERLLEQDQQHYVQGPPMFYGQVPGLIPVAPPSRQPIQLAPIIQPIAIQPYAMNQKQQPAQSVDDDDDYDY
jgi:hypothetical protein